MTRAAVLQSVLDSAGPAAAHIERLWWLMFWVAAVVAVLVLGFTAAAIVHGRRAAPTDDPHSESRLTRAVAVAVGATVVTLFVLLVASVSTGRATVSLGASSAVTINVTGHQFWWEIEYDDATPSLRVQTANEIHIPIQRPVVLKVTSRDVIHSFWAPNLQGKRDLIPGYTTAIWIQADRPAVYRGQCAEFCGKQHAHMAFEIVAEPEGDFERWLDAQREPSAAARTDEEIRGRNVFMQTQCVLCHTIRGTSAQGLVGPNLTHVASRGKIASATLVNTSEHLARWVTDPQGIKPGSQMPPTRLNADDVRALTAYLQSLK